MTKVFIRRELGEATNAANYWWALQTGLVLVSTETDPAPPPQGWMVTLTFKSADPDNDTNSN